MESFLNAVGLKAKKPPQAEKKTTTPRHEAPQFMPHEAKPSMIRQIFFLDGMVADPQDNLSRQTMAAIPIVN